MKTAGVRIDFYDDPSGELLKNHFPTPDSLPEIIKTAHILNPEEREVLRNDAYALVMSNEGKILRKFACVDPGNVVLSVLYFNETKDLLPAEAQKVAAARLHKACGEFGLDVPDFLKTAAESRIAKKDKEVLHRDSMSRRRDSMSQPLVGDDADWASRTNLLSIQSGRDGGRVNEALTGSLKLANYKRAIGVKSKAPDIQNKKPDIAPFLQDREKVLEAGDNIVDVTAKEPRIKMEKKTASLHALGDRYPLDSYADVKKAVEYFSDNYLEMDPVDRHEYCIKTAARADQLGIDISDLMARYGSTSYSPDVGAHLANRVACINDKDYQDVYQELREKQASIHPETFAKLLREADVASGLAYEWGGAVADPYYATFGGLTEKEKQAAWTWEGEDSSVNQAGLKNLATYGQDQMSEAFNQDVTKAFCADPVTVFESMPNPHKAIIARLAGGVEKTSSSRGKKVDFLKDWKKVNPEHAPKTKAS